MASPIRPSWTGGVHYGTTWLGTPADIPKVWLEIVRGVHPLDLERIALVADLPFTDEPGVLSDPALPLVFYRARWTGPPLHVSKDIAPDTVILTH